ncbi:MAG: ATP-binding cassette domain-containing protein [Silvibacterium sp.]|nr:ATP-binding cassette domain-containing protein [Silvibacterium sp.]
MPAAIEFRNVSVRTPQGRVLLEGISFSVGQGTTTALLGRSGSGKTTLLRTVNRMVEPTSGEVVVNGKDVRDYDLIELRRGIGYVIQETGLFPHITVERNVTVVPEISGAKRSHSRKRSHELLSNVGLEPSNFAHRYPHQLSGGQRQRVGLARALAAEPPILLMDEAFGALDPLTRAEMQDMLRDLLARFRKTVLLITHNLDEALYLASQIVLLDHGRLVACVDAADFLTSGNPEVEEYVRAFRRGEREAEEAES